MKVIILAAGKGERLYPLTNNTPKSLLRLKGNHTVLGTQLDVIKTCKIKKVIVVVGFMASKIEDFVAKYKGLDIKTIYNPFYDSSNSIVSCWVAQQFMDEDFIVLNGDTLFHYQILKDLLQNKNEISMAICDKSQYNAEDMKIIKEGNLIKDVGKDINIHKANGESIGMIKLQGRGAKVYVDTLNEMVRKKENIHIFHHNIIRQLIKNGHRVYFSKFSERDWLEMDIHPDIEIIRKNLNLFLNI